MEKLRQVFIENYIDKDNIRKQIAPMLDEKKKNGKLKYVLIALLILGAVAAVYFFK